MSERSHDDEEFERIPWGHISSSAPARPVTWRLAAYGLAGAMAVAGITVSLVSRGDPMPAPSTSATGPTTTTSTTPTSTSAAISEAELMAIPDAVVASEAAAWAEVLTENYWGVDGTGISALAPYLPPTSPLPSPAPGQRIFVESVRALSVREEGPGLYHIVVRASLLSATGDEEYRRLPIQTLAWNLRWERDGWRLLDLPEQVEPPRLLPASELPTSEVPEVIRTAASQSGTVLSGGPVGDLWRVVVAVSNPAGGSWPVVIWYSPDGVRIGG
ncbi:MAG TPA: hypothetical protein VJ935_04665 [Acidimicrobiia bacterium]|nr:hypothetical protein [Acidimicrobiia bacterium]